MKVSIFKHTENDVLEKVQLSRD